ncbi:MAG: NfeD family protein [Alphaproteobacteria bacterium]|nr:NfeD family protein [Alphaproteobacteria bacterium]
MDQIFPTLGPYFWWIVAGLLLLAEMLQPGFFMIWLAAAAALTAIVQMLFHFDWTTEVIIFAGLAILSVAASWRIVTKSWAAKSDAPHLNQQHAALVGKSFYLERAIENGHGKIKVDDRIWDVEGEDSPKGTQVKVTGVDGLRLRVKAV